ncbi:MAG: transposase [Opitutaceae bacterium]|nr:transposase [Opitutaceae bacterium]
MFRSRQTFRLRIGRVSLPGATYFVTMCAARRQPVFASPDHARIATEALANLADANEVSWLAGTVMPDHLHVLFQLGDRLPLARVMAKLKGAITRRINHDLGSHLWQENAFEHRLRPDESAEAYAFYIFMNPYRAALCGNEATWPWWVCTDPARFQFLTLRRANRSPQPEWLDEAERISNQIVRR